ncbi:MAG: hypothetical protein GXY88_04975 [Tissierellia bacterium]|nr:hypothetical protein [Tissierellia bacterium]
MSQNQRIIKRKRKKKLRLLFISFIFLYLFFRSVPSLFADTFKTVLPEKYIVEDIIKTEAIIIKKEYIYRADGEGKLHISVQEGDRVAVGTKIATLKLLDDTSTLKQKLDELDNKIDVLTKVELDVENIKGDEEKIKENIDEIIIEIQESISKGDYEKIEVLKNQLSAYDEKEKDISGDNTLISQSIDNLKKKREEINNKIKDNYLDYFAKEAGIVSFKIDNYEEIYSFQHRHDYTYSDFKEIKDSKRIISDNMDVKAEETIFKIIDNFEWYMILKIDDIKDFSSYKEGDSILLSGKEIEDELKGYIEKINKLGNKGVILCRFNTDFHNFYDKRHMDVDIVKYKYDGYKIPSKCIVEVDGIKGVYIKDISGIIKFRPIEILKEEDKFTYISSGDKNNNITIKGSDKKHKTVQMFDEILLNTINIKEGMIIN